MTRSDSFHSTLFISCRHTVRSALWTMYDEEVYKAKCEGKTLVISQSRKNSPGTILCVHSSDMEEVALAFLEQRGYLCTKGVPPEDILSPPEDEKSWDRKIQPHEQVDKQP